MNDSFTRSASKLAALSARSLGWTPTTFWAATPAELLLSLLPPEGGEQPPSRAEIAAMIERDRHG